MAGRVNKNMNFCSIIYRLGYPNGLANSRKPVYERKRKEFRSWEVCKVIIEPH